MTSETPFDDLVRARFVQMEEALIVREILPDRFKSYAMPEHGAIQWEAMTQRLVGEILDRQFYAGELYDANAGYGELEVDRATVLLAAHLVGVEGPLLQLGREGTTINDLLHTVDRDTRTSFRAGLTMMTVLLDL